MLGHKRHQVVSLILGEIRGKMPNALFEFWVRNPAAADCMLFGSHCSLIWMQKSSAVFSKIVKAGISKLKFAELFVKLV